MVIVNGIYFAYIKVIMSVEKGTFDRPAPKWPGSSELQRVSEISGIKINNFELSPRGKQLEAIIEREQRERQLGYINNARALEEELRGNLVGVWGHLTGAGAREFAVYRKHEIDEYFVVLGQDEEQQSYITKPIDPEATPNGMSIRSIEEFLSE